MSRVIRRNRHLARSGDPITSKMAAATLNTDLDHRHAKLLAWVKREGAATDDGMAFAAVDMKLCQLLEQGRRLARTMRQHKLLVPALLPDGERMRKQNKVSGKWANCWKARD